ncbi:kinase-like domain-containing protein [Lophiotrema nucula]|uniref:non-specific serine/threonine protein kinase n=1 Tax=Lophiotrema nucula TaxID=690887 RepID=A0A6A5YUV3_9PLEO|nr:kinase-like domain-containing protein [Lophiotrema nucula]
MIDQSQYNIGVPAEDLALYTPGGYHPVRINDRFRHGRYEILNKLGFGSFSTVWLARDHQNHCNVSIKVVVANKSDAQHGELEILDHIKANGDPQHPGRKHIMQLMESFHHDGPNGRHLCVVSELLGPKTTTVAEKCQNHRLGSRLARRVSQQLLLAVDYLHSCGVAHGDIHMGNVLFRLSETERSSLERIEELNTPLQGNVTRKDGASLDKGMPDYLVEPIEYYAKNKEHLDEIQLVDFGESFFVASPPKSIYTPMSLHPPELVFRRTLSKVIDIWNLGSTTYELVIGRTPFEADFDDRELIPQFQKVVGGVPVEWVLDAINDGVLRERPKNFSAEGFLSLEEEIKRSYSDDFDRSTLELDEEGLQTLGRYLRKTLVVDPAHRATTKDLLRDAWVSATGV